MLSELLKTVLAKLYNGLDDPDFNLTIDDVPRGDEDQDYFQWHLRHPAAVDHAGGV